MKSELPKVLHPLLGKPMVEYIFDAVRDICADPPLVVVGNKADLVKETLGDKARYVLQEPQLGTAHAVMQAREALRGKIGYRPGGEFRFSADHALKHMRCWWKHISAKQTAR